jgi:hypothetical protein
MAYCSPKRHVRRSSEHRFYVICPHMHSRLRKLDGLCCDFEQAGFGLVLHDPVVTSKIIQDQRVEYLITSAGWSSQSSSFAHNAPLSYASPVARPRLGFWQTDPALLHCSVDAGQHQHRYRAAAQCEDVGRAWLWAFVVCRQRIGGQSGHHRRRRKRARSTIGATPAVRTPGRRSGRLRDESSTLPGTRQEADGRLELARNQGAPASRVAGGSRAHAIVRSTTQIGLP